MSPETLTIFMEIVVLVIKVSFAAVSMYVTNSTLLRTRFAMESITLHCTFISKNIKRKKRHVFVEVLELEDFLLK